MAALLRLAEHLDRGRDGAVRLAQLHERGGELELELAVDGDGALARWGAELSDHDPRAREPQRGERDLIAGVDAVLAVMAHLGHQRQTGSARVDDDPVAFAQQPR